MKALKITSIIFGILSLLLAGVPVMRVNDFSDKIQEQLSAIDPAMKDQIDVNQILAEAGLPKPSSLTTANIITYALIALMVIALILLFLKNGTLNIASILLLVLALVSIALHPSIDTGSYGGIDPRGAAIAHAIPTAIAALCMFFYARKNAVVA